MQVHVVTPESGPRTGFDLALLLAEIDRVLAAHAESGPATAVRSDLSRRTWLLVELELERDGPIEFERTGQRFEAGALGELPCRYLTHLVRAMEVHRVDRMRFEDPLRLEDFARFVELLAVPSAHLDEMCADGFPGRLYGSTEGGIELNGVERPVDEPIDLPARDSIDEAGEPTSVASQTAPTSPAWPALEEDPLEAPAMVMKGEQLRLALRELDRCDDDLLYDALLDRTTSAARELWDQEHPEEAYRALLVLTAHASETAERPRAHTLMAQSALQRFADEEVVRFVVQRGCSCEGGGIRATQVLLELGEAPAQAILDALHEATEPAHSQQLSGMLLALGDNAVPTLARAISRREGARLQRAVRLAGELQNPKLVPPIASLFDDSGPALRREAGIALANIGNDEARQVLFRALGSGREDLAVAAANALAHSGRRETHERMADALEAAIDRREMRVAAALVRGLGPQDDPPAGFAALLSNAFDGRSTKLPVSLRLAAVESLEHRRDERASRWLLAATRDPEPRVSKRAHAILNSRDREQAE